jgi:adenosylcobinamide-phosphate synthase
MPALWCSWPTLIPLVASLLDFAIGDPWGWPHPVQCMGWVIHHYQAIALQVAKTPWQQRLGGMVLGLGLPLLSGAIAASMVLVTTQLHPMGGIGVATVLMASCFAGRSLRHAAIDVLRPLSQSNLVAARERLSRYVGRDTDTLSTPEVQRAVLETISENATDGVMAPLFYALVGTAIAPAAGVSLAIAYKALSTLDSMIGYRTAPYTHLGWFSARSEDVATWLPCRLTVLTIALLSRRPVHVWQLCRRDAPQDPSPNAGWSECAYAAALGVQLGGINTYRGEIKAKPLLAEPTQPITVAVIHQGLQLTRWAFLLWLGFGILALSVRYRLNC